MKAIGIDVGGTSIKGAAVDDTGKVYETFTLPVIKGEAPIATVTKLIELTKKYIKEQNLTDLVGIGLGIPGTLDTSTGVICHAPNLKWDNIPIVALFEASIPLPCKITNDANAAALAEVMFGSGKSYESCILLTLGTGVGGGIVINGKLLEGNKGQGAELGHMVIVENGRLCGCGRRGCFEAYASATGLIRTTKEVMHQFKDSILWDLVEGDLDKVTGKTVFEAAEKKDEAALKAIDIYIQDLGEGILNYCNIFRPNCIILSGGIANAGAFLFDKVNKYLKDHEYGFHASPEVPVLPSCLGYDTGKIGAAALFFQK